jgi:predicted PurR-regulated permease PerM
MKRVAIAAAISLATLTAAALLWRFRTAATLVVLSLAVAAAVRPFVDMLEPRLGRTAALVVVYVSGLALAGVFAYQLSRGSLAELDEAAERIGAAYERLRARPGGSGPVHGFVLGRLPPASALYRAIGAARPTQLLDEALGITRNLIDLAAQLVITVALSAYWSASRESFERLWLSLVPASSRPRARDVWRGVEESVGAHLRSELAQSVLTALLVALVFRSARLPTPMLPALAAALLRLVPFFGALLAGGAAFLAGAEAGVPTGCLAAAFTVTVVVTLDRGVGRGLFAVHRPSPTLTVLFAVVLVDAYGPLGVLLASTVATAVETCLARVIATHPRRAGRPASVAAVLERLEGVRRRLLSLPVSEAAPLANVVARLEGLAADARLELRGSGRA